MDGVATARFFIASRCHRPARVERETAFFGMGGATGNVGAAADARPTLSCDLAHHDRIGSTGRHRLTNEFGSPRSTENLQAFFDSMEPGA